MRRHYLKHGYPDARVASAEAIKNPEGTGYTIVFTVEEGERYAFGPASIELQTRRDRHRQARALHRDQPRRRLQRGARRKGGGKADARVERPGPRLRARARRPGARYRDTHSGDQVSHRGRSAPHGGADRRRRQRQDQGLGHPPRVPHRRRGSGQRLPHRARPRARPEARVLQECRRQEPQGLAARACRGDHRGDRAGDERSGLRHRLFDGGGRQRRHLLDRAQPARQRTVAASSSWQAA